MVEYLVGHNNLQNQRTKQQSRLAERGAYSAYYLFSALNLEGSIGIGHCCDHEPDPPTLTRLSLEESSNEGGQTLGIHPFNTEKSYSSWPKKSEEITEVD